MHIAVFPGGSLPSGRVSSPHGVICRTEIAAQQKPDHRAQSQSNAHSRAYRAERMFFDMMFGFVKRIFGGPSALL